MSKRPRHPHDFEIIVITRNDGAKFYIARCKKPSCQWWTDALSTRTKAVTAAHWHQATEDVKAL